MAGWPTFAAAHFTLAAPSFAFFAKGGRQDVKLIEDWSGREDLNLRPPGPEPGALPG